MFYYSKIPFLSLSLLLPPRLGGQARRASLQVSSSLPLLFPRYPSLTSALPAPFTISIPSKHVYPPAVYAICWAGKLGVITFSGVGSNSAVRGNQPPAVTAAAVRIKFKVHNNLLLVVSLPSAGRFVLFLCQEKNKPLLYFSYFYKKSPYEIFGYFLIKQKVTNMALLPLHNMFQLNNCKVQLNRCLSICNFKIIMNNPGN